MNTEVQFPIQLMNILKRLISFLYPFIDIDGDTLNESMEVLVYHTVPFPSDSDSDVLTDSEGILEYGTDPNYEDGDSDGYSDIEEVQASTDPLDNTSFLFIPADKSYLGLILGLTAGFLVLVGVLF